MNESEFITSKKPIELTGGKTKDELEKENKRLKAKVRNLSKKKKSKSPSKKRKSKSPTRKRRTRETPLSSNVRYFTLMTPDGREIGGRYTGVTPQQAARKLRSQYFDRGNTTTVHLRQTSGGPNYNYTYVYRIKRRKVPASVYIRKLTGRDHMWHKDVTPLRIIRYT